MIRDDPGDHVRHAYSLSVLSLLKPTSHLDKDHEFRTEHSGDVVKLVKYVISPLILRCYDVTARFSLRLTRSCWASRAHQVQEVLTTFSLRQRRSHHALCTTFTLRLSTLTSAALPNSILKI